MSYSLIPTLEFIALVKITSLLWNQADIRTIIFWFPFFSPNKLSEWKEVENAVIEKVSHLPPLPKDLRKRVLGTVKPIGNQIFEWLDYHKTIYFGILHLPNKICWTVQGLLDSRRTAEALIQDKTLHIITRYKLACTYCLQKDLSELWYELPLNFQALMYDRKYSSEFEEVGFLISFWTHEMQGILFENTPWVWSMPGLRDTTSLYQLAFEFSARVCNKVAMEFFLQKLTPWDREDSLARCSEYAAENRPFLIVHDNSSNVMRFLMPHMKEEQQLQVYERYPLTLEVLLEWPWQVFFEEKADRVCEFLSAKDYNYLLNKIVLKMKQGFQDWNYSRLFRQFWRKGTSSHKRYVLDKCIAGPLLTNLLKVKDIGNITLVVQEATVGEKEEMVYYRPDLVSLLIYNDGFNLIQLLVKHSRSSGDIVCNFQREFLQRDLTSLEKKDMAEEKSSLKKFLKALLNLIPKPRGAVIGMSFFNVDWAKADARSIAWKSIRIREKKQVFRMKPVFE